VTDSVEAWRAARYAALRRDLGWLTLAGLSWLREGTNRLGSDPSADVVLPGGPEHAGVITVRDGRLTAGGAFRHQGHDIDAMELATDADGEPTVLEVDNLRLCVIRRGDRLGVRTWDLDAQARRHFSGIDHWPVDPTWRIRARYEPTPGATLRVPDVIGLIEEEPSPASVVFERDGVIHRLQGLEGGERGELWLVFGDETNGHETYGGGRFLYTAAPDADGTVEVDFNRAYNPPCVFSPYATCPLPWPENRLQIRVEAGERNFEP
jgi:uncharacterized protein